MQGLCLCQVDFEEVYHFISIFGKTNFTIFRQLMPFALIEGIYIITRACAYSGFHFECKLGNNEKKLTILLI